MCPDDSPPQPPLDAGRTLPDVGDDVTPRQFGSYRILGKIAEGGMAKVFLAEDMSLKRRVALKFLREDLAASVEARHRLLHEARAAAALDIPSSARPTRPASATARLSSRWSTSKARRSSSVSPVDRWD